VTRGLVVVALDDEAIAHHNAQILAREWSKWYIARIPIQRGVEGLIGEKRMHVKQVREGGRMTSRVVRAGGQQAILVVEAVAPAPGRRGEAHALIRLVTGRFHQVRVMMRELGAPLIGDTLYGGKSGEFYLEHALLRFRPFGAEDRVTVYERRDPHRERLDVSLRDRLEFEARSKR
jgi:23S rRNA-/tRNA-specific pseudouridylate synthase